MINERIQFVNLQTSIIYFSPKWWDKPRWWLVRLLGGECPYDTVKVTTIPIDGKTFAERLFKQKRALMETFRREPTTLLIGAEDYAELMNCPIINQQFRVSSSFNYGKYEVYDLTVEVIPWMRGMMVMPK